APCASRTRSRACVPIPSICPFDASRRLRPGPRSYDENLMLDDPALTTRRVSAMALSSRGRSPPAGCGVEGGDARGGDARALVVGPAGEDDGYARPQHDTGRVGPGQERQVLGQHVAGLE